MHSCYTSYYSLFIDDDNVYLKIKCFEVTVVLDEYHKPTPITTC